MCESCCTTPSSAQPGAVFYPSGQLGLSPDDAPDGTVTVWQMPDIVDTVLERALEQGAQVETVHGGARASIQGASALSALPDGAGVGRFGARRRRCRRDPA
jgi:hypothetical protein